MYLLSISLLATSLVADSQIIKIINGYGDECGEPSAKKFTLSEQRCGDPKSTGLECNAGGICDLDYSRLRTLSKRLIYPTFAKGKCPSSTQEAPLAGNVNNVQCLYCKTQFATCGKFASNSDVECCGNFVCTNVSATVLGKSRWIQACLPPEIQTTTNYSLSSSSSIRE